MLQTIPMRCPRGGQGRITIATLFMALGMVWAPLYPAWAAEKMALVIGNARYLNERPLVNTLNDARAVATQLRSLGFEVSLKEDLSAIALRLEINRFLEEVKARDGTALFYYSGHGMQDRYRVSYLLPIDAKMDRQEDIAAYGVSLNDVLEKIGERPKSAVNLVIVDACRDNPFSTQKGGKGLGRVDAGRGTLVLYAAGPGQTADDRPNEPNGLFTQHLLKILPQPGLDLEDAFDQIANGVEKASQGRQTPYKEGDLRGKFYLAGAAQPAPTPAQTPPTTPAPTVPGGRNMSDDYIFWRSAERCGTPACIQTYLNKYPKGQFADMAQARLQSATASATPQPPVASNQPATPPTSRQITDLNRENSPRPAEPRRPPALDPPALDGNPPPLEPRSSAINPPPPPRPPLASYRAGDEARSKKLNADGERAFRAGRYDQAIELYQAAIALNQNYAQAYSNLGLVFRMTGRMPEALTVGRKAIELASGPTARITRASSYYNNGKVYEEMGRFREALQEYQNAKREVKNPIYDKEILRLQQQGID